MGFKRDFILFYGISWDFNGILWDFMGFKRDFMGFHGKINSLIMLMGDFKVL